MEYLVALLVFLGVLYFLPSFKKTRLPEGPKDVALPETLEEIKVEVKEEVKVDPVVKKPLAKKVSTEKTTVAKKAPAKKAPAKKAPAKKAQAPTKKTTVAKKTKTNA